MLPELESVLGQAYDFTEMRRDGAAAVALLRDALSHSTAMRADAENELSRLQRVIAPHPNGRGRDACHISTVSHDLLAAALKEEVKE